MSPAFAKPGLGKGQGSGDTRVVLIRRTCSLETAFLTSSHSLRSNELDTDRRKTSRGFRQHGQPGWWLKRTLAKRVGEMRESSVAAVCEQRGGGWREERT